jgi:peptide subunit release factor 1 (eRF1)
VNGMDQVTLLTVKSHLGDLKKKVLDIGLMTADEKSTKDDFWNAAIDVINDIEVIDEVLRLEKR